MRDYAYYNGRITTYSEARVSLSDRAIFFGDGVYEVMIGTGGGIYLFREHLDRLRASAAAVGLKLPFDERGLLSIIHRLCDLSGYLSYVIYVQLSGTSERRIHQRRENEANCLVTVTEYKKPSLDGGESVRAILREDRRHGICSVKSINLLLGVMYSTEADAFGADECILHRNGVVTEGAKSNVMIISEGTVITPPLSDSILGGVTRRRIGKICSKSGIPFTEREIRTDELFTAEEVLVTSTTKFLARVSEIDARGCGMRDTELPYFLKKEMISEFLSLER